MNTSKYNPNAIREAFRFLVDEYGYSITRDNELSHDTRPYTFVIEYVGHDRRIHLSHDYRENFFYFVIVRGLNTQFPNESDHENIVSFWQLLSSFEPSLESKTLQPSDQTCAEAALKNAQLLRKYASRILRGEEWI